VNQGGVDYLEDIVGKGYAPNNLAMTAIYRDKPRPNSLPVYIGEFGMALGQAPNRQPITPPDSFSSLVSTGTFHEWLRKIASSSTSQGERKELVQQVRTLAEQCAFEQRSDAEVIIEEQLRNGEWNSVHGDLPAVYEDVRISTGMAAVDWHPGEASTSRTSTSTSPSMRRPSSG
jgi:hypothetical protein